MKNSNRSNKSSGKSKRSSANGTPPRRAKVQTLEQLLELVGIDQWDYLIVGDGSGSGWSHEAGWASVSIERRSGERKIWYGAVNNGTVNVGEIMAYLQPLIWIANEAEARNQKRGRPGAVYRVHIITDSQYVRDQLLRPQYEPGKNSVLWEAFKVYRRQGLVLYPHWLPREEADLNRYADALSKLARCLFKRYNLASQLEDEFGALLVRSDGDP